MVAAWGFVNLISAGHTMDGGRSTRRYVGQFQRSLALGDRLAEVMSNSGTVDLVTCIDSIQAGVKIMSVRNTGYQITRKIFSYHS